MSMHREIYLITGLDIQPYLNDDWEEWKESIEGENIIGNFSKGKITIIEDLMGGDYIYLGYIHANIEDDEDVFEVIDIGGHKVDVWQELINLHKQGLISEENINKLVHVPCKQILFTHYY